MRGTRITRGTFALIVAAGTFAAAASQAAADTFVGMGGGADAGKLFINGGPGREDVEQRITHDGPRVGAKSLGVVVTDFANFAIPGGRCVRYGKRSIKCPVPSALHVHLGAGDDRASVSTAVPAANGLTTTPKKVLVEVWGEDGNDVLQAGFSNPRGFVFLLGGGGDDVLLGSTAREALWGGPGNDRIAPNGGADHIDGGNGNFLGPQPVFLAYSSAPGRLALCAPRTHGYHDRLSETAPGEGVDTLDLRASKMGALADLNVCRLGYFGTTALSQTFAIENVWGTRFNDRLAGDDDNNYLFGGAGTDWFAAGGGVDVIKAADREVDTINCSLGTDSGSKDANDVLAGYPCG